MMNDETTQDIMNEFDEQLKSIKDVDQKDNKFKLILLYTSFVVAFGFVVVSTFISIRNYYDKKNVSNNNISINY